MHKHLLSACLLLMAMHITSFGQEIKSHLQTSENILLTKPDLQKDQDKSVSDDWLSKAQFYIEKSEYFFQPSQNRNNIFFVANRKQRTGFTVNESGFTASPIRYSDKMNEEDIWKAGLQLEYIGKGSENMFERAKSNYSFLSNEENLSVHYNNFSIEYVNDKTGLRQNFIINKRPAGEQNLKIIMEATGNLSPFTKENALQFKNKKGITELFYRDLKVWDANHHPLAATMKLKNGKVVITVNDAHAIYPVTIDPLNQTPEWTTSANGVLPTLIGQLAVDAAYGFSVAGLGDVNGDGYADVGVGAPAVVDIISGSGSLAAVGAVFVFYGSAAGLPTTPGAKLQPTTLVAGALFGFSLAGGDITGDGRNDIIVGAPLDRVTISIGGGNTANGNVGKAYVFNGATLSTNTSPLLTVQLSGNGILRNGINLSVRALFGFSVAVTEDLNGDNKKDIIIGAPAYAGIKSGLLGDVVDVQSGGAFVYLTANNLNNISQVKLEPIKQSLLGLGLLSSNIDGLLFGYAVDGTGDYNGDGRPDVVATAPAGINAGSISGLLNGKVLQGSATVYYGTGSTVNVNPGATLTATSGGLLTNLVGSLANVANLFGVAVRGVKSASGVRNGNILVGAPLGGALINVLGLNLKTGTVNVFKKKGSSPSDYVIPDQVLSSPRNSNNILQIIQSNLLFGYSLDNAHDVNCDGYGDIVVGEPVSSGVQLINANVAGGAAYVYLGNASGTYQAAPVWTLTAFEDAFLGINGTSLIGYSVAGAGKIKGNVYNDCILVGSPSRTLDFGSGLLNLGSTLGTLFSLVAGNNGVGKAFLFDLKICDHSPIAVNDVISTNEDTPVSGNAASNDIPSIDGGNVWSLVNPDGGAAHGTVVMNPDGTYTYTPDPNYNGPDVFTYQVCDTDGDCATATVTVTVNPVDDIPVAVNDVNTTNEDVPVNGNVSTNDTPSGDCANTWSLVGTDGGAAHGSVTMNTDGTYTYTPDANYNGTDVFTYKLCDCDGDCPTATVTITINPVNDVPVAVNDVNTTNEDNPVNGNAATNDTPSGDCANTWSLVGADGGAAHGSVTMNANGTYTYTPDANYNGTDVFTYKLCDCEGDCSTATVTITVNPVNDVPVAVNDVITTNEDNPVTGNAATNDTPSGDCANTWSLVGTNGGAAHGTVTMNTNGTYTYTPAANYNGTDVFNYKLCDCEGDCSTATVTITITPVNDVPVAVNDVITTNEDNPVTGNAATNDKPSGDCANTWSLVGTNGGAAHGTVTMNTNGTYTYTPAANYNGNDVFTYKLCDCEGDCSNATVTITVNPVDDMPVAVNDVNTTNQNTAVNGNAAGNDTPSGDGGNNWALVGTNGGAVNGTVTMNANGTYTYTPNANYSGTDVFTYRLCDVDADCSTATVTITINAVCNISLSAIVTKATCPGSSNGSIDVTVTGANGSVTYLWNDGATTQDRTGLAAGSYTVTATDASNCKTSATYTVTATDAVPPSITCPSNKTLVLGSTCSATLPDYRSLATVSDNCTAAASITIVQSPAAGTVLNGTGSTTVTLTATDASGNSSGCSFTVTRVDQTAPVITCPSNKTLALGATCSVSLPDYRTQATVSDNCTVAANITIVQSPAAGTVLNGAGSTTVTLTATDASGNSSSCSFTVTRADQTPPVLVCKANKTIACNMALTFEEPTATDNCGAVTINIVSTTSTDIGSAVTHTRTWQAVDAANNLSATCSQSITQAKCSAHIFPTSTSCNSYKTGAQPLAQLCYAVSGNKVSNVTPGVFFYFTYITAPSASFCIDVVQTNSCGFKYFSIQQGKQIYLYNSSCTTVASGTEISTGQGRICITNAVPGAQYVLAVKYDSKSVNGSTFAGSAPLCQYNFESRINGTTVDNSQGSIMMTSNCNTITAKSPEPVSPTGNTILDNSGTIQASVYPNPSQSYFNLRLRTISNEPISIRVMDIKGRVVKEVKTTTLQLVQFGNELIQGTYIVEVVQGKQRVILKVEKL
jgi:VCBS repeat-containing protein